MPGNALNRLSEVASGPLAMSGSNGSGTPNPAPANNPRIVPYRGGFEALGSRKNASAMPVMGSPDSVINPFKMVLDGLSREQALNDGFAQGAVNIHRDSIVGSQYLVNSIPAWQVLRREFGSGRQSDQLWQDWAEEWQLAVESRFNLMAESPNCWLDAGGQLTFTGTMRLQVGSYVYTGEIAQSVEWLRDSLRPFKTGFMPFSPDRLCNPQNKPDEENLRRGVVRDRYGKPLGYHIRNGHPGARFSTLRLNDWRFVPARKPWGRKQIIHIYEPLQVEQSRGVAGMVSVLGDMAMTKKFRETTLENAVINASYAAAIESELPSEVVAAAMGANGAADAGQGFMQFVGAYLTSLQAYLSDANTVRVNGAKIPHFFPGTKLVARPLGNGQNIGTDFESSLLRHIAAGLGVSYEELSRNWSGLSYSGGKMVAAMSGKAMNARKKVVADRLAGDMFECWAEEDMVAGNLPLPPGMKLADFYARPYVREALFRARWIGSGRDQIDEMKETQAAMLRVKAGFSTVEAECARLGLDWREVLAQQARENRLRETLGLPLVDMNAQRENAAGKETLASDNGPAPKDDDE